MSKSVGFTDFFYWFCRCTGKNKTIGFTFGSSDGITMDQSSTLHRLQIIWDSDSDTEHSSGGKPTVPKTSDPELTVGSTSSTERNV